MLSIHSAIPGTYENMKFATGKTIVEIKVLTAKSFPKNINPSNHKITDKAAIVMLYVSFITFGSLLTTYLTMIATPLRPPVLMFALDITSCVIRIQTIRMYLLINWQLQSQKIM